MGIVTARELWGAQEFRQLGPHGIDKSGNIIQFNAENNCDLSSQDLCSLSNNIHIKGNLDISRNYLLTKLPKKLTIDGYLNLAATPIDFLPRGLCVKGYIHNPEHILIIEDGFVFYKSATFGPQSLIRKLPKNLTVNESLYLSGGHIHKLPERLYVAGDLDLAYTQINYLPKDLRVDGRIFLKRNRFLWIPRRLKPHIARV